MLPVILILLQGAALVVLLRRLARGRHRPLPVEPGGSVAPGCVSVIVPTLDEARRLVPCLEGLRRQGPELGEILVVDSGSTDGTRELVQQAASRDARVRLLDDGSLPEGWVGKVWALEQGLRAARSEWVLGVDADTSPHAGMVAGVVRAAEQGAHDVVSFSPRFAQQGAAERWLQPALLITLVYRFGAAGDQPRSPDRVMANGQCFLARRAVLLAHGGYAPARRSFADDVTLARHLARQGVRVGFLDGSRLYDVRAYTSAWETWREWGRSLDLKDASTPLRQAADVLFLLAVQGAPIPVLAWMAIGGGVGGVAGAALIGVNAALLLVRVLLLVALRSSYERRGLPYWLSPLADPLAALRILLSSLRRPRRWRSRRYAPA